jgi:hypothetical protein
MKASEVVRYTATLLAGLFLSSAFAWVKIARDELRTPVCSLWVNFSPVLSHPSRELVAKFYQSPSAVEDCELLRKSWNNGHQPTCECGSR